MTDATVWCPTCAKQSRIDSKTLKVKALVGTFKCEHCAHSINVKCMMAVEQDFAKFTMEFLKIRGYLGGLHEGMAIYLARFLEGNRDKMADKPEFNSSYRIIDIHFDIPVIGAWKCGLCGRKMGPHDLRHGGPTVMLCEACSDSVRGDLRKQTLAELRKHGTDEDTIKQISQSWADEDSKL